MAPPPLMTQHASPSPWVTSPRSGSVSQTRDLLHTVHVHESLYVQYSCHSDPSQEGSEYVKDLHSFRVGSTNPHRGLSLVIHINTTSVEFIFPSCGHARGAAVLREEVI